MPTTGGAADDEQQAGCRRSRFTRTFPAVTRAQDAPVEQQIVNQMNKVFGVHAGFRANHAKGVVAEGKFNAS